MSPKLFKSTFLVMIITLVSSISFAHPGHGHLTDGIAHHLFEPYHILPVILISAAMFIAFKLFRKEAFSKKKK